ncbi:TetR/AcrR family transcriptional regulator [Pseudonocardia sp.]|uniref:TetR/AcrR family transcriptional regulator n=1 Tax=Pseudonocardia sp. TaxID=60912 RepID=UPI003D1408E3
MARIDATTRSRQLVAAARSVMAREGVARTSLRTVAAEGGVPLGTLQYVFPSKELLLRAVIEDVTEEIADVFRAAVRPDGGLEHAIRAGVTGFWSQLVAGRADLQVMQYELTTYALRTPGQENLARWQYARYVDIVAGLCQEAAARAGETCAIPFAQLGRLLVAGVDGLILQHVCGPDPARSRADLDAVVAMLVALAGVRRADDT